MTDSPPSAVLAIDGGGTHCRTAISAGGTVVSVTTGAANVSTDFAGAVAEVRRGLDALAAESGWEVEALTFLPVFAGLAGVTGPALADRVRTALPFGTCRIGDDRPAAVRGALGRRDGFVAHCGTGSFFAAQTGGSMRFAGGWGPVLGDEASAHWLGRLALRLALASVDGRRQASEMSDNLLSEFEGSAGIVRFAATAGPPRIAALAVRVTDLAERGDPLAREAMAAGAAEIARSLADFGWTPGMRVCLTGGLGTRYTRFLPGEVQAALAPAEGDPLDGALSLAREFAEEVARADP